MENLIKVISPIDNSIYAERTKASSSQVEKALELATIAQRKWKHSTMADRQEIGQKVVDYFVENATEIGKEITWQMGRPIAYSPFEISKGFKERAEYMISIASQQLEAINPGDIAGYKRYIKKEALGVVLVLAPWNYPFLTSVNAIIPAIMAGNSVILKHATQTPLCAERYASAFEKAGLPSGVFQYLHMDHSQVSNVVKDHRINYVAFTGSEKGGRSIVKSMDNRFISSSLELGGKDAAYVRHDANVESAIENLVDGSFFNSGQSCCGIERIYVHEKNYDSFLEGFIDLTYKYKLGNPLLESTTLGPMVRTSAALHAKNQIENAMSNGAKTLIDSGRFQHHKIGTPYMAPQVVVDVNNSMEIMQEETFGPVVGIMKVKSDNEALAMINDSKYGLTASLWTENLDEAEALGNKIDVGTVYMNRCDYLDPSLAWTGVKNSGRGCSLSTLGYNALTRPKSFHFKIDK